MPPLDLDQAVRETVAGETAVIAVSVRHGRPLGKHLLLGENGVADLRLRRAHLHGHRETIHDGTTQYVRDEDKDGWIRDERDGGPFWPLDLPRRLVVRHERLGGRVHRGEEVDRHRLELAVPVKRRSGGLVARRDDRPPRRFVEDVELWLGDDGRIRLAAHSIRLLDPLPPARSRLARDLVSIFGFDGPPLWRTVELFSYGVAAPIRVPREDELVRRFTLADVRIAGELAAEAWRHRQDIRRYFRRDD